MNNIKHVYKEEYGNAPRAQLLKNLPLDVVHNRIVSCLDFMEGKVHWQIIGKEHIQGKNEMKEAFHQYNYHLIRQLHMVIVASVNGALYLYSQTDIDFCNIFHIAGFS